MTTNSKSKKAIGIDLGTTNSCVAYLEMGKPVVIKNKRGGRTIPSVVSFDENGIPSVGEVAKRQRFVHPERTVISVKRKMGTTEKIVIGSKSYTPEQISGFILGDIKGCVSDYLNENVVNAVITVPAYFNDSQRASTKDAAELAGLHALRIINEPTAAALAYKFNKNQQQAENILVFDLGGGTFDVSVLSIDDGVFQVKATSGDNHLGGDDFDAKLFEWVISEIASKTGEKIEAIARERIMEAVERAKCDLSGSESTHIQLPLIVHNFSLDLELTRAKFDYITKDLVERTRKPTLDALNASQMSIKDIGSVILVGGSTRLISVKNLVKDIFQKEPAQDIDPDEVVAVGAAIEAGVKLGTVSDIVLVDVTPLSLGIETKGGVMTVIIPRNTAIPTEKKDIYTTTMDNQPEARVVVYQGERPMAADNHQLGEFGVKVAPAPQGQPKIEVKFYIDENGMLEVTAEDKDTHEPSSIRIANTRMSEFDKKKATQAAEEFAELDRKKVAVAQLGITVEKLSYDIEAKQKTPDLGEEKIETLKNIAQSCSDLSLKVSKVKENILNASDEEISALVQEVNAIDKSLTNL